MLPIVMALSAAACWGFAATIARAGLEDLRTEWGVLFSLWGGALCLAAYVLATGQDIAGAVAAPTTLAALVGLGVVQFIGGRFFNYAAVRRVGSALGTALFSTSAVIAVVLAFVLFGDVPGSLQFAGLALVTVGVMGLVSSQREAGEPDGGEALAPPAPTGADVARAQRSRGAPTVVRHSYLAGIGFGLLAATAYALGQILGRSAATAGVHPLVGAAAAAASGAGLLTAVCLVRYRASYRWRPRAILVMGASGLIGTLGVASLLTALARAPVSVVAPVVATSPFWALATERLVLRSRRQAGARGIASIGLIVVGVVLVGLQR